MIRTKKLFETIVQYIFSSEQKQKINQKLGTCSNFHNCLSRSILVSITCVLAHPFHQNSNGGFYSTGVAIFEAKWVEIISHYEQEIKVDNTVDHNLATSDNKLNGTCSVK